MLPGLRENRVFRFTHAAATATRILSGYKMLALRKSRMTPAQYEKRLSEHHRRSAQRIYRGVLRLQGLMIKIGQTIGSRPDVFPEEYASVLSRLQDQVPPHPWKEMKPHIERELGGPIESVFAEFDPKAVAAASLAQVYKAKLKDGRQVAVKVVYPNSPRLVKTDLRILRGLIWLEARVSNYPLEPVYQELAANVPLEVDMLHEAEAMRAIASTLSHRDDVVIPGVIAEHTTKRLLTMEYIDGIKITNIEGLRAAGIDTQKLFPLLVEVYMEQIMRHGHFHADPHPGNLFGLPGNRLGLLDFGLTKKITDDFREAFKLTTRSMFTGDNDGLVRGLKAQGLKHKNEEDDASFIASGDFFRAMADPETYKDKEIVQAVNEAWAEAFKKNPLVDMPGDMTLAMRVFFLLFGLGATVGGNLDLQENNIPQIALKYAQEPETIVTPPVSASPSTKIGVAADARSTAA
jgi:predicted unusual protein kinase regulating ubiquinone biosynthesis (AarF/ABC1/UbiB family)